MHSIGNAPAERADYTVATLFFIPRNVPLTCQPITPFDITTFVIPDRWFKSALRNGERYEPDSLVPFECQNDQVLMNAARLLKSVALEVPSAVPPDMVATLIMSVAARVLRTASGSVASEPVKGASITTDNLKRIAEFVDRNLSRHIMLPELASIAGLSQYHFSREFKAVTGSTPMQYVTELRIKAAKVMLAGTLSLAEISLDCGFASQSHFATVFRAATGMTPSAWRAAV